MAQLAPEQQSQNWNQVARRYAEHIDPVTSPYAADALDLCEAAYGDRVLDVASGAGAATVLAAARASEVVAIDFSDEMVSGLQDRIRQEGIDNVTVSPMDAQDLDLPDDGFDAAISVFGVMMVPDRVRALAEMHRVLKPEGRAVVTAWQAPPDNEWMEVFFATMQEALPDAPPPTPPSFMEWADADLLADELRAAGFADVEIRTVKHGAPWEDSAAAWAAIAESNPVFGPMLQQLEPATVAGIREAFDRVLADRGNARLQAGAHLGLGRKA